MDSVGADFAETLERKIPTEGKMKAKGKSKAKEVNAKESAAVIVIALVITHSIILQIKHREKFCKSVCTKTNIYSAC